MKLKINLRDQLVDQSVAQEISIPATFDTDELLEVLGIPEEFEIAVDLDELLEDNRLIAHLWSIEDVQERRPDLNDDQAWQVLQAVQKSLDSEHGISWETIEWTAEDLFAFTPAQRWSGHIAISVDNYSRDEAMDHFSQLAAHLEKEAVNSTTRASFDPATIQLVGPGEPAKE